MEMQNATVHVTNNFHILMIASHNKNLQNPLAFCLSSFQEHSSLGSPQGSCFSTNPHRKGHRVGRSQRCKDASTCLAPWDTVNDEFKKCCQCQFCNPNFRSWFRENLKVACKVYRAKRHVSSWVTTWTQLAAFGGSFCWWIRQKTSSVFRHRMIWIFQAQRNVNWQEASKCKLYWTLQPFPVSVPTLAPAKVLNCVAMATLIGQLPVWIAATLATWAICWTVVSPEACQDSPACNKHLKTYPGSLTEKYCKILKIIF